MLTHDVFAHLETPSLLSATRIQDIQEFPNNQPETKTLEHYERNLVTLLENLPDIIARFDQECRYLYITPNYEVWSGLKQHQVIGRAMAELPVPKRLLYLWQKAIRQVFTTGQATTIEYENQYGREQRFFETRLLPEFDAMDLVESVLTCTREITQTKSLMTLLETRERRLRALIEHSADAMTLFDAEGNIIYASPASSRLLGVVLEKFVGINALDFIHPEDVMLARTAFRKSLAQSNIGVPTEVRVRRHDGSWCWVAGTFTNLLADPDVMAVLANYGDSSERRMQNELIQKREEQYRTIIENLPDAMVAQIDLDMRFSFVGGKLLQNWGRDNAELENCRLEDCEQKYLLQASALYREAFTGVRVEREIQYHGKNVKIYVIPTFDKQQRVTGANILALDVTDIHTTKAALQTSQKLFQAAFEQSQIGMAILDLSGSWQQINPALANMLGYTIEELQRKTVSEVSHPQEYHTMKCATELLEVGQAQYEKRYLHKHGYEIWARVHVTLVNDGVKQYAFKQIENISSEKYHEIQIQELNTALEQRLQRLQALRQIDNALNSSLDLSLTLGLVVEQIRTQLDAQAAAVLLYYPESLSFRYFTGRGFKTEAAKSFSVRLGQPLGGIVGLDRMALVVPDVFQVDLPPSHEDFLRREGVGSFIGLPLLAKGELLGVIEIYHHQALQVSSDTMDYLEMLVGQAALAIENTRVLRALQYSNTELAMAYDETIEGWSRALDLRDKETEGHSRRVTEMTVRLARAMNLPESEIIHMRRGALLHDIGKMGVPDEILLKPGKLTDDEWVAMRKHPDFAYELLAPIGFLGAALDIPYAHHEKWDGTGYPRGLKGSCIPLAARIFAVVDVWDALKSDRPYRPGWTTERVIEHIRASASTHFDPQVVEVFLSVLATTTDELAI